MESDTQESPHDELDKETKIQQIKDGLLERFGKTARLNPETNEMDIVEAEKFDNPQVKKNMMHNCGTVSRIVHKTIGGVHQTAKAHGTNPTISYENDENIIASGGATAFHAFVVDDEGMVWDPIVDVWGDVDIATYTEKLQSSADELVIGEAMD